MNNTLLPCPFCGGEATISDVGYSGEKFLAHCRELSCLAASGFIRKTQDEAIAAWNRRAQPENEPLTTSELRKMDGEPVYVITLDNPLENQPYWAIAGINSNDSRHQNGVALYNRVQGDWGAFDLYGKTWLAYRTKPEGSEG